jgi:hypothetical protein
MPRKVFTAGEVLAAADVNSFLMDQAVQTFASSAARSSAIGTATEGMVTWLNDENALQVYDGTAWNGLAASGGNAIINGAFEINQRGFTSGTAGGYVFDRWTHNLSGASGTASVQSFTLGSAPVAGYEGTNFARINTTVGNDKSGLRQTVESVRSFAGQTVTISFFAKGTNPSTAGSLNVLFSQVFGTGGSPSSVVDTESSAFVLTANWTRYALTVNIPSIAGKTIGTNRDDSLALIIGQGINASTDPWTLDIWGVQLEAGPTANVFRRNANSLQGELAACQRYYNRRLIAGAYEPYGTGVGVNSTTVECIVRFNVPMRAAFTSLEFGTLLLGDGTVGRAVTNLTSGSSGSTGALLIATVASGITQFRPYNLVNNNSAAGFLAFSAEL